MLPSLGNLFFSGRQQITLEIIDHALQSVNGYQDHKYPGPCRAGKREGVVLFPLILLLWVCPFFSPFRYRIRPARWTLALVLF